MDTKKIKKTFKKTFVSIFALLFPSKRIGRAIRYTGKYQDIPKMFEVTGMLLKKRCVERTVEDCKYYVSVVATVKDEGEYIEEWLEYHKYIGVQHFYIYDNESSDNLEELLAPYIKEGLVTYIAYPGQSMQLEIYNHALDTFGSETYWLMYVDIDEFFVLPQHDNLSEYLKGNENYDQIVVPWYIYGDSGYKVQTEGLVIERFTFRCRNVHSTGKSISRSHRMLYALVHKHCIYGKEIVANPEEVRCHHYYGKSEEEFINKKIKRGDVMHGAKNTPKLTEFRAFNKNDVHDDCMEKHVEPVKKAIAETRSKT